MTEVNRGWSHWKNYWQGEYVVCRILQHSLLYSLFFATRRTLSEIRQTPGVMGRKAVRREAVG